jgi:hypothetical protein
MASGVRLTVALLSLPGPDFRLGWLHDRLAGLPADEAARELDALCEEGERSVPDAREALLTLAMLLARLGDCELVDELRAAAHARSLWSLDRLLRRAPPPALVERPSQELPVPDYGTGRELSVGERRSLARRPNRRAFEKLLADPHPLVLQQLLHNPKLTEDDVVLLATRRPARAEAIQAIAAAPRWLSQARVRMAILLNPGSPSSISMPLVALCTRQELRELTRATDTSLVLRATARELLERRPPLPDVDPERSPLQ